MKIETQAIHAGFDDDPTTRAVAAPIYQTTSFSFRDTQHGADLFNLAEAGNIYSRIMNPTCDILEQRIAAMEGGAAALCVASGMAAITASMQTLCAAGDNFVSDISNLDLIADVVDMEAYAIAKACKQANVNFRCFKYVSDLADENASDEWQKTVANGEQEYIKIFQQIIGGF